MQKYWAVVHLLYIWAVVHFILLIEISLKDEVFLLPSFKILLGKPVSNKQWRHCSIKFERNKNTNLIKQTTILIYKFVRRNERYLILISIYEYEISEVIAYPLAGEFGLFFVVIFVYEALRLHDMKFKFEFQYYYLYIFISSDVCCFHFCTLLKICSRLFNYLIISIENGFTTLFYL